MLNSYQNLQSDMKLVFQFGIAQKIHSPVDAAWTPLHMAKACKLGISRECGVTHALPSCDGVSQGGPRDNVASVVAAACVKG